MPNSIFDAEYQRVLAQAAKPAHVPRQIDDGLDASRGIFLGLTLGALFWIVGLAMAFGYAGDWVSIARVTLTRVSTAAAALGL